MGEGGREEGSWAPPMLEGQGRGPRCCCSPLACGHGCREWSGGHSVCTTFPAATGFSEAVGSAASVGGPGLQARALRFLRPRCVFQYTQLWVCRCVEFSSALLCWAEAPLLSCGCFTGCRLKGGDTGSFSTLTCF